MQHLYKQHFNLIVSALSLLCLLMCRYVWKPLWSKFCSHNIFSLNFLVEYLNIYYFFRFNSFDLWVPSNLENTLISTLFKNYQNYFLRFPPTRVRKPPYMPKRFNICFNFIKFVFVQQIPNFVMVKSYFKNNSGLVRK